MTRRSSKPARGYEPNYSNPGYRHCNAHLFPADKRARHNPLRSGPLPLTARTVAEKLAAMGQRLRRGDLS